MKAVARRTDSPSRRPNEKSPVGQEDRHAAQKLRPTGRTAQQVFMNSRG